MKISKSLLKKKAESKKNTTKGKLLTVKKSDTKSVRAKSMDNVANEFSLVCDRVILNKAIGFVSGALNPKHLDAKAGIYMETKVQDNENYLHLTANSDDAFISTVIKLQDDVGIGSVCPNGTFIAKLVSAVQPLREQIEFEYNDDDNKLVIKCGDDYEADLPLYDSSTFIFPPTLEEIQDNETITIPVKFIIEALKKVSFCVSSDQAVPELTGIFFEQRKNEMNIVASDASRVSCLSVKTKNASPKSVIVGPKYLMLLANVFRALEIKPSTTIQLYLSDDKLFFIVDKTVIGLRVYAGSYPIKDRYKEFLPANSDCELVLHANKAKFVEKLNIALFHLKSQIDNIVLVKKGKRFFLKNNDSATNTFSIEVDMKEESNSTGKSSYEINFAFEFLSAVMTKLNDKDFTLALSTLQGPAIVRPANNKDEDYAYTFSLN